jgi:cytochrome c-type biogenesis protein CcmE
MANKFKKIKPRRQRLYFTLFSLICLALAAYFIASQFKENFMYFLTPGQIEQKHIDAGKTFRLGGLVKEKSLKETGPQTYEFLVTDTREDLSVTYKGMLPSLFREGQGVIANGKINNEGVFVATEILAKHDENYMPREVYEEIKKNQMKAPGGENK